MSKQDACITWPLFLCQNGTLAEIAKNINIKPKKNSFGVFTKMEYFYYG